MYLSIKYFHFNLSFKCHKLYCYKNAFVLFELHRFKDFEHRVTYHLILSGNAKKSKTKTKNRN